MALSSSIVWEVRTTGSDTNGGGFKTGATGTDRSQQNAAQYSVTDAVTAGTTTITSATASFGTDVVGNVLYIQGGTGAITAGWYEITARTNTTTITVDRSTGLTTGTGATLIIGGALLTINQANTNKVTGNVCWVKGGTYAITSTVNWTTADGTPGSSPTALIGYNTSRGDNPVGTNCPTISSSTAGIDLLTMGGAYTWVMNLWIDGGNASRDGILCGAGVGNSSRGGAIHNVGVTKCTRYGIFSSGSTVLVRCRVTAMKAGSTIAFLSPLVAFFCQADNNPCTGFGSASNNASGGQCVCCVSALNTGASSVGFNSDHNLVSATYYSCIAYKNGGGGFILNQGTYNSNIVCMNCISYGNTGYGVRLAGLNIPAILAYNWNAYASNSSGNTQGYTVGPNDVTLTGDPFVDGDNLNFALNNTAGAGAACKAVGYPGVLPGATTTGYLDIGIAQSKKGSGSLIGKGIVF